MCSPSTHSGTHQIFWSPSLHISVLGGFKATNKTFCRLLLHSVRTESTFGNISCWSRLFVALVLKLKIGQNKSDDFVQWGATCQGPHCHHYQGTITRQLTEINLYLYLVSTQFRDEDLPPLRYGANHTLVVKSLNNSRGDLPFMTHSDEVGDILIIVKHCLHVCRDGRAAVALRSSSRCFSAFSLNLFSTSKSYYLENSFYELIKILQSWDDTKLWCNNNSGVFWTKGCCPRLKLLQNLGKEIL